MLTIGFSFFFNDFHPKISESNASLRICTGVLCRDRLKMRLGHVYTGVHVYGLAKSIYI